MISRCSLGGSGSVGCTLSTGFQVCLSKCWDPYVSAGWKIRLAFFWVFPPCFSILILSLPLLELYLKSTCLSPGFCVCRSRQYNTICCKLHVISRFFVFSWWIVQADWINECGWCLPGGRGCWLKSLYQVPSVSWSFHHSLHFYIH